MSAYPNTSTLHHVFYGPDTKYPLRFAWISLFFIYVLQYPLSRLIINASSESAQYDYVEWMIAYSFVIVSSAIIMASLYVGMAGSPVRIDQPVQFRWTLRRRIRLSTVMLSFALFFLWSYLMLHLKIGMTIYADFDPLPFKLVGLLVYGRLCFQPLILAYIARSYASSGFKWFVFPMLVALGVWVSLTSGSRFAGIMFALPMLFLYKGKSKYVAFSTALFLNITVASLTRHFYLPFQIGGEYIEIYANEAYQATITESIILLPIYYIIGRPMGMAEVLMTLNFGEITPSFLDSLLSLFSYFVPFVPRGDSVSIKNIYGHDDDSFGGLGLDMFSNYWVFFGGSLALYLLGLVLIGWMLGKTYRLLAIALMQLGFKEGSMLIFVLLFILIFEGRGFLFTFLLIAAYILSRRGTFRILRSMFKPFRQRCVIDSSQSCHMKT